MSFQRPRILTDIELNQIRGKCLVAAASPEELMLMIGHFDLMQDKLHSAIETLSGCFPDKLYIYGACGEYWSESEPDTDEFEVIDFKELLGENQ